MAMTEARVAAMQQQWDAGLAMGEERVVCFGEMLMRLAPPDSELPLQSASFRAGFGGAEANVAISLATFGHPSRMVSAVPDHAIGRACVGELRRHGVDVSGVRLAPGRMGLYYLVPGAMQRASEVIYDRADSVFARASAAGWDWPRLLAGAHWLHLTGINLALAKSTAWATLDAVHAARAAGVRVSFDCNYRSRLWGTRVNEAPALLREVVAGADLLFGNAEDIALILGGDVGTGSAPQRFRQAAAAAFAAWPRLQRVVATERASRSVDEQDLGARLAHREHGLLASAPRRLAAIVERIGSGDAFAAGFLHGLLIGMDDQRALDFALAAACLKHSVPGDANLVRAAEVDAVLAGRGVGVRR